VTKYAQAALLSKAAGFSVFFEVFPHETLSRMLIGSAVGAIGPLNARSHRSVYRDQGGVRVDKFNDWLPHRYLVVGEVRVPS